MRLDLIISHNEIIRNKRTATMLINSILAPPCHLMALNSIISIAREYPTIKFNHKNSVFIVFIMVLLLAYSDVFKYLSKLI